MHVQEVLEQIVDVPRAAGDVEDRVERVAVLAPPQRLVEGADALEREPRVGIVAHHDPGHLQHAGRAGADYRVVEVTDHTETGSVRNEDVSLRISPLPHPETAARATPTPPGATSPTVERLLKPEAHLEEALLVGRGLGLQIPEGGPHPRAGDFVAREAPAPC